MVSAFSDLVEQVRSNFWLQEMDVQVHVACDRPTLLYALLATINKVSQGKFDSYIPLILSSCLNT